MFCERILSGCGCDTLLVELLAIRLDESNTLAKSLVMAYASRLREQPRAPLSIPHAICRIVDCLTLLPDGNAA
jgi:hypothetical protein